MNELKALRQEMESLRCRLHQLLEEAGGQHGDPEVLKAAEAFDEALNRYLRLSLRKRQGEDASGEVGYI